MPGDETFGQIRSTHPNVPPVDCTHVSADLSYGDFEKGQVLGFGGSAQVHRSTVDHDEIDCVALKEPREGLFDNKQVVQMFSNEAELWSQLEHPHIVGVVDWGTDPHPWIALEYADGGSLRESPQPDSLEAALYLALCLARAVKYAHTQGVVHLDLKPDNVMVSTTPAGYWDVLKVTDWGLAKLQLFSEGAIEGLSYRYAAPEQVRPTDYDGADERTDIYQLGGVIYSLLTGHPPVDGSKREMVTATVDGDIDPPTTVNPALPHFLDEPIMRALAVDPDDRYEDVLLIRRSLERAFTDVYVDEASPQTRSNSRRTGVLNAAGASEGSIDWHTELGTPPSGQPVFVDDTCYVAGRDGNLHCLSVHSGTVLRTIPVGSGRLTAPTVGQGRLFVGDGDGTLHALTADGEHLWSNDIGHSITAAPAVSSRGLVVVSADGEATATDLDGTPKWTSTLPGNVHASPSIRGSRLYVPTYEGIGALSLETGTREYIAEAGTAFRHPLPVVGDTLYAGTTGAVSAIEGDTGTPRWELSIEGRTVGLAVTESTVFASTDAGRLYAIATDSGSLRWAFSNNPLSLSPPTVGTDQVVVGGSAPGTKTLQPRIDDLVGIDRTTGTTRWSAATDSEVTNAPIIVGDAVVAVSSNGTVYSIR